MTGIMIGRYVNGISLNDLEYLLNDKGDDYLLFDTIDQGIMFLNRQMPDTNRYDIQDAFTFLCVSNGVIL